MNVGAMVGRAVFYSMILLLGIGVFGLFDVGVSGDVAGKALAVFAGLAVAAQSMNLVVVSKIQGVEKNYEGSFWASWRLESKLDNKISTCFSRIYVSAAFSVVMGLCAWYMWSIGDKSVPFYILGVSTASVLLVVYMWIATVRETANIVKFEREINKKAGMQKAKQDAKSRISFDPDDDG